MAQNLIFPIAGALVSLVARTFFYRTLGGHAASPDGAGDLTGMIDSRLTQDKHPATIYDASATRAPWIE